MSKKRLNTQREIAREIANEIGGNFEEVLSIIRSQSAYLAYTMEHSGFETVMLPYLGKFYVNPKQLQYINNKNIIKAKIDEAI